MKHPAAVLTLTLLAACAATDEQQPDPIDDFIKVNELEDVGEIRTYDRLDQDILNDYYVIIGTRREHYLLVYRNRCRELPNGRVAPDIRRDSRVIRAGVDTYRGCQIDKIFSIDAAQAEELRQLGARGGD